MSYYDRQMERRASRSNHERAHQRSQDMHQQYVAGKRSHDIGMQNLKHGQNMERDTHQNELGQGWRDFLKDQHTDNHALARDRLNHDMGAHTDVHGLNTNKFNLDVTKANMPSMQKTIDEDGNPVSTLMPGAGADYQGRRQAQLRDVIGGPGVGGPPQVGKPETVVNPAVAAADESSPVGAPAPVGATVFETAAEARKRMSQNTHPTALGDIGQHAGNLLRGGVQAGKNVLGSMEDRLQQNLIGKRKKEDAWRGL